MKDSYYTAADMEALLDVDRSTVYRMADAGRLPAYRVGRQWRFPADAVSRLLQDAPATAKTTNDLAEILPLSCVQQVLDIFAESMGVMLILTDMHGYAVTEVSHPCGFFQQLRDYPSVWGTCENHWREMADEIDLNPHYVRSTLGLLCARGFVRVGPTLKGMVFVGGIAPDSWPPAAAERARIADGLGVPQAALDAAIDDVFYLDAADRSRVLNLVQRVANVISHMIDERTRSLAPYVHRNGS